MYNRFPSALATPDPHSNTGSDSQAQHGTGVSVEAGIDALTILWLLNGSLSIDKPLERFTGVKFERIDSIGRKIGVWWDRNYSSVGGSLLSERIGDNGKIYCRLAISGKDCARIGSVKLRGFMIWAVSSLTNLRCSRIDLAIDDYDKKLKLCDIQNALEKDERSGFIKSSVIVNHGSKKGGWCVYLGVRSGERLVRIYDKSAESKGRIDSIRWETEFHDERADSIYRLILGFPKNAVEFAAKIIDYALGGVSFIERNDKNISRCPLLEWWREWLQHLDSTPVKVFIRRAPTSLQDTIAWLERAVSKSLASCEAALGQYYFSHRINEMLIVGKQRMRNIDYMKVDEYRSIFV